MLISVLWSIFSKSLSFIFFGLIWSQSLKFSNLIEIWLTGTLLYAYYNVNIRFSKISVTYVFGQIWSNNLDFFKLTETS